MQVVGEEGEAQRRGPQVVASRIDPSQPVWNSIVQRNREEEVCGSGRVRSGRVRRRRRLRPSPRRRSRLGLHSRLGLGRRRGCLRFSRCERNLGLGGRELSRRRRCGLGSRVTDPH